MLRGPAAGGPIEIGFAANSLDAKGKARAELFALTTDPFVMDHDTALEPVSTTGLRHRSEAAVMALNWAVSYSFSIVCGRS